MEREWYLNSPPPAEEGNWVTICVPIILMAWLCTCIYDACYRRLAMSRRSGCLWPDVLATYGQTFWLPMARHSGCLWPDTLAAYSQTLWLPIARHSGCLWPGYIIRTYLVHYHRRHRQTYRHLREQHRLCKQYTLHCVASLTNGYPNWRTASQSLACTSRPSASRAR